MRVGRTEVRLGVGDGVAVDGAGVLVAVDVGVFEAVADGELVAVAVGGAAVEVAVGGAEVGVWVGAEVGVLGTHEPFTQRPPTHSLSPQHHALGIQVPLHSFCPGAQQNPPAKQVPKQHALSQQTACPSGQHSAPQVVHPGAQQHPEPHGTRLPEHCGVGTTVGVGRRWASVDSDSPSTETTAAAPPRPSRPLIAPRRFTRAARRLVRESKRRSSMNHPFGIARKR